MDFRVALDSEQEPGLTVSLLGHDEVLRDDVREIRRVLTVHVDTLSQHAVVLTEKVDALQKSLAKWAVTSLFINTSLHLLLKYIG
jgi:hypothetical protein